MIDAATVSLATALATLGGVLAVGAINTWTAVQARRDARSAQHAAIAAANHVAVSEQRQSTAAEASAATLSDIKETVHIVHTIVNSEHTKLLQLVARLAARVAIENPQDAEAQRDAAEAVAGTTHGLQGVEVPTP